MSKGKVDIKIIHLNSCKTTDTNESQMTRISEFLSENPKLYGLHITQTCAVTFHKYMFMSLSVCV